MSGRSHHMKERAHGRSGVVGRGPGRRGARACAGSAVGGAVLAASASVPVAPVAVRVWSWWRLLAREVQCAQPVVLTWDGGTRHGVLDLVRICGDGSAFVRFADRSSIDLPALKGEM